MKSAPRNQSPPAPAYMGLPFTATATADADLTNPFAVEIVRLARMAAREEYHLLSAETAAAAVEVEQAEELDTVRAVAAILKIQEQTVYQWFKSGKLKGYKVGRAVRFKRGEVLAVLKAQTLPDGRRKYARRTNSKKA